MLKKKTNYIKVALFLLGATFLSCSDDDNKASNLPENPYIFGSQVTIGHGIGKSYVRKDSFGNPTNIGLVFTKEALEGLPDANTSFFLPLPLNSGTVVDHLSFDFVAHGHHPEGIYDVSHFDVHFYNITQQERDGIDLTDPEMEILPTADYIPADYISGAAEAKMGKHWVDITSPELPQNGNHPFQQTFIYGSYNGRFIFQEPMIALTYLLSKPNVVFTIKQLPKVHQSGYYPTKYSINYDSSTQLYTISLDDLVYRSH